MITSDTDASLKWCSTPSLWHIDAVGRGVHPIINPAAMEWRYPNYPWKRTCCLNLRMSGSCRFVLPQVSKIVRAAGAVFVQRSEGRHRLTLNSIGDFGNPTEVIRIVHRIAF
jgi:hypothetical protein